MRTTAAAVIAILLLGISGARPAVSPVQPVEPSPITATVAPSVAPAPSGQAAPANAPATDSLEKVCTTLVSSAHDNDLPVPFFANLIWQESRLREHAVSPKGAMGIAQLMPQVAAQFGVADPFDPSQELPASAKMLRTLYLRFGNLGYVAAAYNAGTKRVLDWLERGRSLPSETRGYVVNITGRSVEAWRKTPANVADLRLTRGLPCSSLPAFAELAQAQPKQADATPGQAAQATSSQQPAPSQGVTVTQPKQPQETAKAKPAKLHARNDLSHKPVRHKAVPVAKHGRQHMKREADKHIPVQGEQRRRA